MKERHLLLALGLMSFALNLFLLNGLQNRMETAKKHNVPFANRASHSGTTRLEAADSNCNPPIPTPNDF